MENLLAKQRAFFDSGATRTREYRVSQLKKLRISIKKYEKELYAALADDLGKPEFEAFAGEIGFLFEEIAHTLRHIPKWMKAKKVSTPLTLFRSTSRILSEPKGQVLILAPWNYPIQLSLTPLIAALSAGNTVLLKPSEFAPASSRMLKKLLDETFPPEEVLCLEGDAELSAKLTQLPFDHLFFTGSTAVGKKVYAAAAKNLVPVTLELGGKSPCIVDRDVPLELTAKRIVWGKFLNAGQTCIAPDMLYVDEKIFDPLIAALKKEIESAFGADPLESPDLAKIINDKHFERLKGYLQNGKIVHGGKFDQARNKIAPTLLIEPKDSILEEEIFGPILPVIPYRDFSQLKEVLKEKPKPLAFYVFSQNQDFSEKCLGEFSFGGGCVNDCVVHLGNPNLPFGGIGASGMGAYHGETGFLTFSHQKSVLNHSFFPDFAFRYRPYAKNLPMLKRFMRSR